MGYPAGSGSAPTQDRANHRNPSKVNPGRLTISATTVVLDPSGPHFARQEKGTGQDMGIVRFALRFPHTFYVVAALIVFLGVVASRTMPTDIFPEIRIPVVTVIWSYTGLSTPEMEQRVTHLQPVLDQRERQRHQEYRGADA